MWDIATGSGFDEGSTGGQSILQINFTDAPEGPGRNGGGWVSEKGRKQTCVLKTLVLKLILCCSAVFATWDLSFWHVCRRHA